MSPRLPLDQSSHKVNACSLFEYLAEVVAGGPLASQHLTEVCLANQHVPLAQPYDELRLREPLPIEPCLQSVPRFLVRKTAPSTHREYCIGCISRLQLKSFLIYCRLAIDTKRLCAYKGITEEHMELHIVVYRTSDKMRWEAKSGGEFTELRLAENFVECLKNAGWSGYQFAIVSGPTVPEPMIASAVEAVTA